MYFSSKAENQQRLDSVGLKPFCTNFLSKVKDFRKWINKYQFLKAGIVDGTAYEQKLDYM